MPPRLVHACVATSALLALVAANACAGAAIDPVPCESLVVANWNVRRLFDARCDSGRCGDAEPEGLASEAEVEANVARIGAAARELDADVVILEEVENDALLERIALAHGGVLHRAIGESPGAGTIDVGVLSRIPIAAVHHHVGVTLVRPDGRRTTPTRDLLEVTLAVTPHPVTIFGAHLKSQRDDDPGRRYAEADYAGGLVATRLREGRAFVVLAGDLNDVPGSPPLIHLERDFGLFRVTSRLPSEDAYSIVYGTTRELVDHAFVSSDSARYVSAVRMVRGASVGYGGSDHAALRVAFALDDDAGVASARVCVPFGTDVETERRTHPRTGRH